VLNDTIREALNEVSASLSNDILQRLNRQVGVDKRDPADVASQWVRDQGLVD
jgi:osmoprotectant transport system substrate-binding protein